MSEAIHKPSYAPKVPVGWIIRLYRTDALGLRDTELADKVGWRMHARCCDVLMVTASRVVCPVCQTEFAVPWVNQPVDRISTCSGCGWNISAGSYHASFRHQDLLGHAPAAFTEFVERFPGARSYEDRMLLIDRLVHAVHTTGGVAARNLLEGRPREVLARLDALAGTAQRTL
jgi:ribosomal protein L37AE/L43A